MTIYYSRVGIITSVPGDWLTLSEAASRLGVSRRRAEAMVLNGQLPAERIGNQWAVSAVSARAFDHNMWREPGRPLAQATAWELFDQGKIMSGSSRHGDLDRLRRRLRSRARHLELYVHPSLLRRLQKDSRAVIGGRHAAAHLGVPVDEGSAVDAYVRASDEKELLRELAARKVVEGANLNLHVVDDAAWPFAEDQRHVEEWVAWLDLADGQDRAADTLLDRLIGGRFVARG
jgi:excisionase family DNA binding protein